MENYICTIIKGALVGWHFQSAAVPEGGRTFQIAAVDKQAAETILMQHVGPITRYVGAGETKATGWNMAPLSSQYDELGRLVELTKRDLGSIEIVAVLIEKGKEDYATSLRVTAREGDKVRVLTDRFSKDDERGLIDELHTGLADRLTRMF